MRSDFFWKYVWSFRTSSDESFPKTFPETLTIWSPYFFSLQFDFRYNMKTSLKPSKINFPIYGQNLDENFLPQLDNQITNLIWFGRLLIMNPFTVHIEQCNRDLILRSDPCPSAFLLQWFWVWFYQAVESIFYLHLTMNVLVRESSEI